MKPGLSWNFLPQWLAFIVLEGKCGLLQEKTHQWPYPESCNDDSRYDVPTGIIANVIIMGEF